MRRCSSSVIGVPDLQGMVLRYTNDARCSTLTICSTSTLAVSANFERVRLVELPLLFEVERAPKT